MTYRCRESSADLMADPAIRQIVAKAGGDPYRIAWYALRREHESIGKGAQIVRLNRQLGKANRARRALHRLVRAWVGSTHNLARAVCDLRRNGSAPSTGTEAATKGDEP